MSRRFGNLLLILLLSNYTHTWSVLGSWIKKPYLYSLSESYDKTTDTWIPGFIWVQTETLVLLPNLLSFTPPTVQAGQACTPPCVSRRPSHHITIRATQRFVNIELSCETWGAVKLEILHHDWWHRCCRVMLSHWTPHISPIITMNVNSYIWPRLTCNGRTGRRSCQ